MSRMLGQRLRRDTQIAAVPPEMFGMGVAASNHRAAWAAENRMQQLTRAFSTAVEPCGRMQQLGIGRKDDGLRGTPWCRP